MATEWWCLGVVAALTLNSILLRRRIERVRREGEQRCVKCLAVAAARDVDQVLDYFVEHASDYPHKGHLREIRKRDGGTG